MIVNQYVIIPHIMYSSFCWSLNTNILGLYLLGKKALKSLAAWYLVLHLIELLIRHLLPYCCTKRNHMSVVLGSFFIKAYFALQYRVLYQIIMYKPFIQCYPDFQSCWTHSFFSEIEENALFSSLSEVWPYMHSGMILLYNSALFTQILLSVVHNWLLLAYVSCPAGRFEQWSVS